MEQLVVFDYYTGTIDIYNMDTCMYVNDDYIQELGYNLDLCSWMCTENLNINFKNKKVKVF